MRGWVSGQSRCSIAGMGAMLLVVLGIGVFELAASRLAFARQTGGSQHAGGAQPQGGAGQENAAGGAQGQAPAEEQEKLAAKDDTRPAEQVYKNIQVLKGMPADQFLRTMKGFTNSLGVRCEFCHVTAPGSEIPGFGAFSKDDLEAKRTARKMILMVGEIREKYFAEKEAPTCWTCHRGNKQPEFAAPKVVVPAAPPAEKK